MHPYWDNEREESCLIFVFPHIATSTTPAASLRSHNMNELSQQAGMKVQTLRNKLNPEQMHQLTVVEMLPLTDLTEDATLMDGVLAQLQCLPCVPVSRSERPPASLH